MCTGKFEASRQQLKNRCKLHGSMRPRLGKWIVRGLGSSLIRNNKKCLNVICSWLHWLCDPGELKTTRSQEKVGSNTIFAQAVKFDSFPLCCDLLARGARGNFWLRVTPWLADPRRPLLGGRV